MKRYYYYEFATGTPETTAFVYVEGFDAFEIKERVDDFALALAKDSDWAYWENQSSFPHVELTLLNEGYQELDIELDYVDTDDLGHKYYFMEV